jgi:multidrug resistance efflux pump
LVVEIDDADLRMQLEEQEADLLQANADVANAKESLYLPTGARIANTLL